MQLPSPAAARPFLRRPTSAEDYVWLAFLVWTAIGSVVMPLGIGEAQVVRWLNDGFIRRFILGILPVSDAVWITLAAILVYLHTAAAEGLSTARRWTGIILLGSGAAEWVGAQTGFPFGPYRYTEHFGWRIGGILPAAIPLAWLVILLCGRTLTLRVLPGAGRLATAFWTACLAVLTDLNLEFVAWKIRSYWVWYPDAAGPTPAWPPAQNFFAWFVVSFALVFALPPNHALRLQRSSAFRPVAVLALMNALFLLTHTVWLWRVSGR